MQNSRWTGTLLAALSGVLIAIFGFLGDINKSGIKRDVGVKDSGMLIPGQGGMMDRVDSLTFSAPVFFYFVKAVLLMNRDVN
jgi:phosphatidate cytidylyltransferase